MVEWFKKVKNGSTWFNLLEIVQIGSKLLKLNQNIQNTSNWFKMATNESISLKYVHKDSKSIKIAQHV